MSFEMKTQVKENSIPLLSFSMFKLCIQCFVIETALTADLFYHKKTLEPVLGFEPELNL